MNSARELARTETLLSGTPQWGAQKKPGCSKKRGVIIALVALCVALAAGACALLVLGRRAGEALAPSAVPEYRYARKSLFVWGGGSQRADGWSAILRNEADSATTLREFCLDHGFSEVVLYVGALADQFGAFFSLGFVPFADGVAALVDALADVGIRTWLLTRGAGADGAPLTDAHLSSLAVAAADLDASSRHGIEGLHVAPGPGDYPASFLRLVTGAREHTLREGVRLAATLPAAWTDEAILGIEGTAPLGELLLTAVDALTLASDAPDLGGVAADAALLPGIPNPSRVPISVALGAGGALAALVAPDEEWYTAAARAAEDVVSTPFVVSLAFADFADYYSALHGRSPARRSVFGL